MSSISSPFVFFSYTRSSLSYHLIFCSLSPLLLPHTLPLLYAINFSFSSLLPSPTSSHKLVFLYCHLFLYIFPFIHFLANTSRFIHTSSLSFYTHPSPHPTQPFLFSMFIFNHLIFAVSSQNQPSSLLIHLF